MTTTAVKKAKQPVPIQENIKERFEEWEVRRIFERGEGNTKTSFEKLKLLRSRVLITQEQADVLNHGRFTHDANNIFTVYLLPDESLEKYTIHHKTK